MSADATQLEQDLSDLRRAAPAPHGVVRDIVRERTTALVHRDVSAVQHIGAMQLDMLSEREVRDGAVVHITETDNLLTIDGAVHGPRPNGLIDARMGPVTRDAPCETCGGALDHDYYLANSQAHGYICPGHFGRIELPGALFNCQLLETVVAALRCFCWFCGELPGTAAQNADAVRALAARDSRGAPLTRRTRLELLSKQFGKRLRCESCRRARRCGECPRDAQCATCATAVCFRPKLVRARVGVALPDGVKGAFPYHYQFKADDGAGAPSPTARAAFDAFVRRERIGALARDLTPERARRAAEAATWRTAALLAPELPAWLAVDGEDDSDSDIAFLARAFGGAREAERAAARAQFAAWFGALVPRVLPVAPNCVRPTRFAGANYADPTWNELTVNYRDLLLALRRLERHAAHMVLQRAPETFSEEEREARVGGWLLAFRGALVSRNAHTGEEVVQRAAERWCDVGPCDMHDVGDHYALAQYHYALLINPGEAKHYKPRNSSVRLPATAQRGAARTKNKGRSFARDAEHKDGLLRGHLMGKRVDFSARSVITGDPTLAIDEIGVPRCVAAVLTRPHRLCSVNIVRVLRRAQRIIDGEDEVFNEAPQSGAARPQIFDAEREQAIDLLSVGCVYEHPLARVGSIVELPIEDGDYVLFNRAPSLHRPSFMAHRVRIMRGKSFRLNLAVTPPYNADFDGDEMNMHVPQSLGATAEAAELMTVRRQLLLPKDGGPCIGLVQDHLLGAYLMTREHAFLERAELMQLWLAVDAPLNCVPQPAIVRPRPLWTARQLVSALLPESLTLRAGALDRKLLNCVRDTDARAAPPPALVQRGTLHYGALNKSLAKKIVGALCTGAERPLRGAAAGGAEPERCIDNACRFLNGMTRLTTEYLTMRGFSIGISDVVPDESHYAFEALDNGRHRTRYAGRAPPEFVDAFAAAQAAADKARNATDTVPASGEAERAEYCLDAARESAAEAERARHEAESAALRARVARAVERVQARTMQRDGKALAERRALQQMTPEARRVRIDELRAQLRALDAAQRERRARAKELAARDGAAFLLLDSERRAVAQERVALEATLRRVQRAGTDDDVVSDTDVALVKQQLVDAGRRYQALGGECAEASRHAADERAAADAAQRLVREARARAVAAPRTKAALAAEAERADEALHELCARLERDGATRFAVAQILERCAPRVRALIHKTQREWTATPPGPGGHMARVEALEQTIMAATTEARDAAHAVVFRSMSRTNAFRLMVDAGSKGSVTNAGEIMACPGQQTVNGRRTCDYSATDIEGTALPDGEAGTEARLVARTLRPRFMPHDANEYPGAEEGGMIFSSLLKGLRPREFFHYAVGARSNLIDTACKTAPVGYLARRLIKMMEDLIVCALGGVRTARNVLLQPALGGSGFAPQFMQRHKLPPLLMADAALRRCVYLAADDVAVQRDEQRASAFRREARELRAALGYLRERTDAATYGALSGVGDVEQLLAAALAEYAGGAPSVSVPFAECVAPHWAPSTREQRQAYADWRCDTVRAQLRAAGFSGAAVDPQVRDRRALRELLEADEHARHCSLIDECEAIDAVRAWLDSLGALLDPVTRAQLRLRLCAKQLVRRHAASRAALDAFFDCYGGWLQRARAVAGDAVGVIAAQSFSSVGMQMTVGCVAAHRCWAFYSRARACAAQHVPLGRPEERGGRRGHAARARARRRARHRQHEDASGDARATSVRLARGARRRARLAGGARAHRVVWRRRAATRVGRRRPAHARRPARSAARRRRRGALHRARGAARQEARARRDGAPRAVPRRRARVRRRALAAPGARTHGRHRGVRRV